jgi:hypothetical protein
MKLKQSENQVKKAIKDYLELSGYHVFRINNGAVFNQKQNCWISHQTKGVPDLLCINKKLRRLLFIETKATKKKASIDQLVFLDNIDGIYSVQGMVCDSLDSLISKII